MNLIFLHALLSVFCPKIFQWNDMKQSSPYHAISFFWKSGKIDCGFFFLWLVSCWSVAGSGHWWFGMIPITWYPGPLMIVYWTHHAWSSPLEKCGGTGSTCFQWRDSVALQREKLGDSQDWLWPASQRSGPSYSVKEEGDFSNAFEAGRRVYVMQCPCKNRYEHFPCQFKSWTG